MKNNYSETSTQMSQKFHISLKLPSSHFYSLQNWLFSKCQMNVQYFELNKLKFAYFIMFTEVSLIFWGKNKILKNSQVLKALKYLNKSEYPLSSYLNHFAKCRKFTIFEKILKFPRDVSRRHKWTPLFLLSKICQNVTANFWKFTQTWWPCPKKIYPPLKRTLPRFRRTPSNENHAKWFHLKSSLIFISLLTLV